jgi:IclR family transcriptional regulator, KDG regulon repressor
MKKQQDISQTQEYSKKDTRYYYSNNSLERVSKILLCLSNGFNTSSDIARKCNYSISTVHRLLNVMKGLNLASRDSFTHKYYLGPLLVQISYNQAEAHRFLVINAFQEMMRLFEITGETINLNIMIHFHPILLHSISSKHELRIVERDQDFHGLFAMGATGKVLFSQLSDDIICEVLLKIEMPPITDKSIIDRNVLLPQLLSIRKQGYAVTYGERVSGGMGISAPIENYRFPAALSILAPEIRLKHRKEEIVSEIKRSARRISQNISQDFQDIRV